MTRSPPYEGAYVLAILAAVKTAADMAYKTMTGGSRRHAGMADVVTESVACGESLIAGDYDSPMGEF